jgi:tetratricopeptide (TPR) repeat protein
VTDPSVNNGNLGGDAFTGGKREINTAGGTYVEGDVRTAGDFVAGDKIAGDKITIEAPPTGVAALHQLPAPLADFTGRAAELDHLRRAAREPGAAMLSLRGMGGIGKTALAVVLANELSAAYPDAQFFLDLQGTGRPLAPAAVMAHVIRAYKPVEKLPEDPAQLQAIYRSLLSGQRALLLFDNARDADQIRPLVPPAGCLLLITSRRRFTLPGLSPVNLDSLSPADAEALLLKIAPRLDTQAAQLGQLCGYLPLALRLAGSALAEREDLEPADYARRLSAEQARVELVDASLSLSVDLLSDELQALWRALAVFPVEFDATAAAEVWALKPEPARDRLGELLRYSLVDFDPDAKRYSLHDLARDFAHSRLAAAERDEARRRHARHYAEVLSDINDEYLKGGNATWRGLARFDLERAHIVAGQAWAASRAATDDTAAALADDYPGVGAHVLDLRQHPRERIAWLEAGLSAARHFGRRWRESTHLGSLGLAHADLGELRQAITYYEQDWQVSREIGNRGGEAAALGNMGLAYAELGESRRALEYYQQALPILRETAERRGEANVLMNSANAHLRLGDLTQAIDLHQQALAIFRAIGDQRGEGNVLGNLGLVFSERGEHRLAIEHYQQALVLARAIGDRRGEASALWNEALACSELGERAAAIAQAEAALGVYEQIEDTHALTVRRTLEEWKGAH